MKCHFDGRCEINTLNRHTCRFCRLKKCFASGMQSELLRGSRSKTNKTKGTKRMTSDSQISTSTVIARTTDKSQLQQVCLFHQSWKSCSYLSCFFQFPTLNLLQADQSTMSVDQWNLLSNLIHCYDEHSGLSVADRFVREQNALPIKARFKTSPVSDMITSLMGGATLLFEKNADFLLLSSHDRSLLLHGRLKYIASLGCSFILRAMKLYTNPRFYSAAEVIFGSETLAAGKRTGEQIDLDIIFVKLTLAIILFSTLDNTVYMNTAPVNLENVHAVLRIQDTYTDLAWRYLIYKYDYSYAVTCFSNIIRCIFNINDALTEVATRMEYKTLVDGLIKQTEEIFVQ
jgi:hypothetical protein